jgi:hypothetical protein
MIGESRIGNVPDHGCAAMAIRRALSSFGTNTGSFTKEYESFRAQQTKMPRKNRPPCRPF